MLLTTAATAKQLVQPPLKSRLMPLLVAWIGLCGGWYSTVLWIPEYFKARGAGSSSLYAQAFAVAAANLPGIRTDANYAVSYCTIVQSLSRIQLTK